MITGLNLISATPRKSKKISVLMEVEDTDDNIRAFSNLYRKRLILANEPDTPAAQPDDKFELLIKVRTRCQQIQDMITDKLEPLPIQGIKPLPAIDKGRTSMYPFDEMPVTEPPANDFYGEDVE